jgi:hypothetical protein
MARYTEIISGSGWAPTLTFRVCARAAQEKRGHRDTRAAMLLRSKGASLLKATRFEPPIVRRFPRAIFLIARAMRFRKILAG